MIKIIETPFEFLGKRITKAVCKSIEIDSKEQQVLTCDLFTSETKEGKEQDVEVYKDKAWVLGSQPFELTQDEIDEVKGISKR